MNLLRKLLESKLYRFEIIVRFYTKNPLEKCKTREEQSQIMHSLMTYLEDLFNDIHKDTDEKELELNGEGIESVVTKNLYDRLFNVKEEEEMN